MAGLLGSVLAGAAGKVADGRVKQIERQEAFNMENALLDARMDKEVRLKQMGYEMDDARTAKQQEKRAGYFNEVEDTTKTPESVMNKYTDANGVEQVTKAGGESVTTKRAATMEDATARAIKAGDLETAEGLLKMSPKKDKSFDSIKLDDGSVMAFDKSNGTGKIISKGGGTLDVPKNEIDLAWRMADGDPKKAAEILVSQKARVSAAGRAPDKLDNDDLSYADWKKKPANKDKGRDDYTKEKSSWGKENDLGIQTVTEEPVLNQLNKPIIGKDGKPMMTTKTQRKERVPEKKEALKTGLVKSKDGNYIYQR
jgi:hypothetical protein